MEAARLYRNDLNIVAELDGTGALVSQFVYGAQPHVPDFMLRGGKAYRIVSDERGSVRLVVDTSTGAIAQRMDYDAWGNVTNDTNPGFQPFGFAGGLYDRDTGFVRFGKRDFDPASGRWASKDPIVFAGRQGNLYVYVGDEPTNSTDPLGLWGITDAIGWTWGLLGWAAGGDAPSVRFDPKAGAGLSIEFTNNPFQRSAGYSTTYGNVICYAGAPSPGDVSHELAHTRQYQLLGDAYLPAHVQAQIISRLLTGNYSDANPLETGPYSPSHSAWPWGG